MKYTLRRLAVLAAVPLATLIATVGAAPAANAGAGAAPAANAAGASAADPRLLCGPGYVGVRQEAVVRFDDPVPVARFHLMYNPFIDTFCGVTVKTRYVGVGTETMAAVGGVEGPMVINAGPRLLLAGPVYDRPDQRCVLYGASLIAPDGQQYFHETANPAIGWSRYCLA
jgi:hypothetical protein